MPDGACYANAAYTARTYREHDLVYAEGIAALSRRGVTIHLPHAWCVTRAGDAIDPTWEVEDGTVAYFGVPVADAEIWPARGEGLLEDFGWAKRLLRDGLLPGAVADRGYRPPPVTAPPG